jgi:hypothetical protein
MRKIDKFMVFSPEGKTNEELAHEVWVAMQRMRGCTL